MHLVTMEEGFELWHAASRTITRGTCRPARVIATSEMFAASARAIPLDLSRR